MGFVVVIPARYHSTRLPGKPLLNLAGRAMVEHVYYQAVAAGADEVVVATDDERIAAVARRFAPQVVMTRSDHRSGTDRISEVVAARPWSDDRVVVNLQGDEPLMPPAALVQVANLLKAHPKAAIATLATPIVDIDELWDPNIVKVVTNAQGEALYFSRAAIPHHRTAFSAAPVTSMAALSAVGYRRHLGLYAYRADVLRRYPTLASCALEESESLEQLRALWHGLTIQVATAVALPPPGVDTPADLARVEAILSRPPMQASAPQDATNEGS